MPHPSKTVIVFFLVTYVLTWFGHLGNWIAPSGAWPVPMNPLGPIIAAPLVLWAMHGSAAVRVWGARILRFRAPLWVYATALLGPLAIIVASVSLARGIGTPSGALPVYSISDWLIGIPLVALFGPAPEEPAFRGLAQQELESVLSPFAAALWIGLGVVIWHIPLFAAKDIPLVIALTLPAVSIVYAWLFIAGGSVWPLVVLHWVVNFFGGQYFGKMFAPEHAWIWLSFMTLFYLAWAAGLVWRLGSSLGKAVRPPQVAAA